MTLTPDGYLKRLVDKDIICLLRTFGAVSIEGPKWCGKTWAARNASNSEFQLDRNNIKLLNVDRSFAMRGDVPHLIDEWQFVPELWDDVRFEIDRSTEKGRFILCGSSTPDRSVRKHSGAGRIATLNMHTMSLFETGDSDGHVSLSGLFKGSFSNSNIEDMSLERLISYTIRGGWPGLICSDTDPIIANRDYLNKLCNEDVISIDGVQRKPHKMMMLIRSLARNESTVVSDNTIINDMKEYDNESVSPSTLADYEQVLERLNIIRNQPAFNTNIRSSARVGKNSKRHLADPSLAMSALGMDAEGVMNDLNTFGFIFEALCEHDLGIYAESIGGRLCHYRDSYGNEVDAIVEIPNGAWGAFEIKLGTNQIDKASESLLRMRDNLFSKDRQPSFLCVICGMSTAAYRRPDGVYVVPITRMGP